MYSQGNEEQYILEALIDVPHIDLNGNEASFLDIGAYHPTVFSNTRALYEAGWGGLMVEPSPACMLSLIKEYGKEPRIQLLQAAMLTESAGGYVELHVSEDAISTIHEANYEAWKDHAKFDGELLVRSITPEALFAHFGGSFEFWSIDTEGGSVDLLRAMLACGPRPTALCVEHDGRHVELAEMCQVANYVRMHCNETNEIWKWTGKREG